MRINQKAEKKMCLAKPKTQLFELFALLGAQNAHKPKS